MYTIIPEIPKRFTPGPGPPASSHKVLYPGPTVQPPETPSPFLPIGRNTKMKKKRRKIQKNTEKRTRKEMKSRR